MSRSTRTARGNEDAVDPSTGQPAPPVPRRRRAADYAPSAPARRGPEVPVWALVVVAVLMLAIGGAAGHSLSQPSDPEAAAPAVAIRTATPVAIDEPDPLADAVEPSVAPSTTTTTSSSAATAEPVTPDVSKAAVSWVFNRTQPQLVEIIEQDPEVGSVERLELDLDANLIRLDFTSSLLRNRDREADATWTLVQRFAAPMFSPDGGSFYTEAYTPGLAVTTGGTSYSCSSDTMIRLATFAATRTDFENEC